MEIKKSSLTNKFCSVEGGGDPGAGGGVPAGGAPAGGDAGGGGTAVQNFDWGKTGGVDAAGLAIIQERQWKNPAEMLNSYRNLEKLTGVPANQLIKLPKGNDPGEWGLIYDKMGRPKTPEAYNLPIPEGDKGEFAKVAGKWFHEAGLSEAQGRKLAEIWNGYTKSMSDAETIRMTEQTTIEINDLKKSWGNEYQSRSAIVDRAGTAFGMTNDQLEALKIAMGPKAAMEFMYNIGSKIAVEDANLIGAGSNGGKFTTMTPEVAKAEIMRLKKDRSFGQQMVSGDPKVKSEAQDKLNRLHQIAFP